ncbi:hypothetical protein J4221_06880 [Candidatus Pacearchaeota archaeon]|nr:hypothetical protein [Candidatus Pacearchaeota archaeon]
MNIDILVRRLNGYEKVKSDLSGGNLNELILLRDDQKKKYILQVQKKVRPVGEYLSEFFETVGIEDYRYRSLEEQVLFSQHCLDRGLLVPKIFEHDYNYIIREFIEGTTYSEVLSNSENALLLRYLQELMNIHKKGIVLGDRWGPNELVTPDGEIYFFDFDIELLDENNEEFEIAHAIYTSVINAKNKKNAISLITKFFENGALSYYDCDILIKFLERHITFYEGRRKRTQTNEIVRRLIKKLE